MTEMVAAEEAGSKLITNSGVHLETATAPANGEGLGWRVLSRAMKDGADVSGVMVVSVDP